MAFSCGFYNAVNHDRNYNATQFGDLFSGLINDGVYASIGHALTVAPVSGMTVKVRSGRAWFNKTWNVNDSDYPLDIPVSDLLLPRIDTVILEVDTRLSIRNNSLKVIQGRAANDPSPPTLIRAGGLYQYPLAYITVKANVRMITAGDIEIVVGKKPTPFVTGIIKGADISDYWAQWDSQFHTWFNELQTNLSGDVAKNLQNQINELKNDIPSKASSSEAQEATNDTKWMSPAKTNAFYIYRRATPNEVINATEQNKWMSPLITKVFYQSQKATEAEVVAGTEKEKWVSPYTLSKVLGTGSGGGSSGSGGDIGISVSRGSANDVYGNSLTVDVFEVKYYSIAGVTVMSYDIAFTMTQSGIKYVTLRVIGLPDPTEKFFDSGVLALNSFNEILENNPMFYLFGYKDSSVGINLQVQMHGGTNSGTTFQSGTRYVIAGNVVYF